MIAVYAPGSVSNVACGFDCMGFALDEPGDIVIAAPQDQSGVSIAAIHGDGGRLTTDPRKNTASAAVLALLRKLETTRGVALTIHKGLPLASGVGSSGASAVAAVVAANELLGRPAPMDMLLECAMAGEQAGCGSMHPDNVTPSLYGGFILARSAQPPDIVRLPVPDGLACAVLHPRMEIETGTARQLVGEQVRLQDATRQWANVGGLVAALYTGDLALLSRSLVDHVAEPKRAALVPGLADVKAAAIAAGALGCSLSGSGPSIFALAATLELANDVGKAMQEAFSRQSPIGSDLWVCLLGKQGARVVSAR
ncbi:MAG TPA: homoserine kinase [Vicinamibacterales bacterium]|nr:homoserine kinase [Vicinamibacterales bacterium]